MTAIASEPIHLGPHPAAWNRIALHQAGGCGDDAAAVSRTPAVTLSGRIPAIGCDDDLDVSFSLWSWTTLMDGVMMLGVVWTIPVAVLAVGTPVALAVAFLLWLVRLALHAF
jgi:hypothetical protein